MRHRRSIAADVTLGSAASVPASWIMNQVTTVMYEREDRAAREREDNARGGRSAMETVAEKAAKLAGRDLTEEQRKKGGELVHWGISIGAGAVYGAVWNLVPRFRLGSGVTFGVLQFLLLDEGANTLLGITPPPREFPWQAHVRGLVGHIVFGAALEAMFHLAERSRHMVARQQAA